MRFGLWLAIAVQVSACTSTRVANKDSETATKTYGSEVTVEQRRWNSPVYTIVVEKMPGAPVDQIPYSVISLHMALTCDGKAYEQLSGATQTEMTGSSFDQATFRCLDREDITSLTYNREKNQYERFTEMCSWPDRETAIQDACQKYKAMAEQKNLKAVPVAQCKLPVSELKSRLTQKDLKDYGRLEIYAAIFADYYSDPPLQESEHDIQALAFTALRLAADNKDSWNSGNVIHLVHLALGRIALQKDDLKTAIRQLNLAASTPGSPQLNSFGPNMLLAKELVEHGQVQPVIDYINDCKKFWKPEFADKTSQFWLSELHAISNDIAMFGAATEPDFGPNVDYGLERELASITSECKPYTGK